MASEQQQENKTPEDVAADLAGIVSNYEVQLRVRGITNPLRGVLVRDYHALTLATFYGLKGVTLPATIEAEVDVELIKG